MFFNSIESSLLKRGKLTCYKLIGKKALKYIKTCTCYKKDLMGNDRPQEDYFLMNARADSATALMAPSTSLSFFIRNIYLH